MRIISINTGCGEILESKLRNLIKEYNITDTRGTLYKKPIRHADYCFVTKEMKVKNLSAVNAKVSDHMPLILDL